MNDVVLLIRRNLNKLNINQSLIEHTHDTTARPRVILKLVKATGEVKII